MLASPNMKWISIPARSGGAAVAMDAFSIAKYPVTIAQYALFIEAGGYSQRKWWTNIGWDAREQGLGWDSTTDSMFATGKAWMTPRYWGYAKWHAPDKPVIGVSWYEAAAFCQWLSDLSGETISLTTEAQWQRAAQGDDDRTFPWGNTWDSHRCNNGVDISPAPSVGPSPVRQYEGKGDSPFGVVDMCGNVWEWCLTTGAESESPRRAVLLGGSWSSTHIDDFRVTARDGLHPANREGNFGFRCVRR